MDHKELVSPARRSEEVDRYPTFLRSPTQSHNAKEMLKSPLLQKNQLRPPMSNQTTNIVNEMAQRTEKKIQSPLLHCYTANANIRSAHSPSKIPLTLASKAINSRQSSQKEISSTPRCKIDFNKQVMHNIENFPPIVIKINDVPKDLIYARPYTVKRCTEELVQSPLQIKFSSNSSSKGNQLKPPMPPSNTPITEDFNLIESLSKNIHGVPRRTEEMLKSPLHCGMANIRSTYSTSKAPSKKYQLKPPMPPSNTPITEDFNLIESLSKNMHGVPRRTEEMLKSPLHCGMANIRSTYSASKVPLTSASKMKAINTRQSPGSVCCASRRNFNVNHQAVHKIKNLKTPTNQNNDASNDTKYLRSSAEPCSTKELIQSQQQMSSKSEEYQLKQPVPPSNTPITEDFNLVESLSKNMHGVPRRTEEMLKSPLHCGMANIRSTHSASKVPLTSESKMKAINTRQSPGSVCCASRRNFNVNHQAVHKIKNLKSPTSQNNDASKETKYLRSSAEPCSTKELIQSQQQMSSKSEEYQLKPPMPHPITSITKDFSLIEPMSKNMHGEPRRAEEKVKLHCANANIRSVSSTTKIPLAVASGCVRKLDFTNTQPMRHTEKRILRYLKQIPAFRVILNRGMHQINLDDFVSITNHLIAFTGIQIKPLNKENYIEQTIFATQLLKYPYKVNKSSLRLPILSYHSVMRIFDFLLDFAPMEDDCLFKDFNFYSKEYKIWCDTEIGLRQELFDVSQNQDVDSIKHQLCQLLQEEASVRKQLIECHQQLHAVRMRSLVCEQKMGKQCFEIWRKKKLVKQLKMECNIKKDD